MRITYENPPVNVSITCEDLYFASGDWKFPRYYFPFISLSSICLVSVIFTWDSIPWMTLGFFLSGLISDRITKVYTEYAESQFRSRFLTQIANGEIRIETGPHSLELSVDGLRKFDTSNPALYKWSDVRFICESPVHCFIQFSNGTMFMIPKIFPELQNANEFIRIARQHWKHVLQNANNQNTA